MRQARPGAWWLHRRQGHGRGLELADLTSSSCRKSLRPPTCPGTEVQDLGTRASREPAPPAPRGSEQGWGACSSDTRKGSESKLSRSGL